MHSSINLPITPESTPVNILYSSANLMTHRINPATSIVIESFLPLGLERRLRRYERVRDVMNSWDRDSQNSLLVLPCDLPENDKDLDIDSVPRTEYAPLGFNFHLYHSQRPGKWQKRYITLLENGQMFAAKKPEANPVDKDTQTLCHLSDFDIYSPTETQMRKHLKPPKKFCYAIKSQQKSAVFINGENFVHFFCTEDVTLAHRFHEMVHAWRSWYLVNRRVALPAASEPPPQTNPVKHSATKSTSVVKVGAHGLKASVDETPYIIGAFEPLIDMNRFDKPLEEFGKDFPSDKPVTHRAKEIPRPKHLSQGKHKAVRRAPATDAKEEEFASSGLLGTAYDERRQAARKGQSVEREEDGPFVGGLSLLNGGTPSEKESPKRPDPNPWPRSAAEKTTRQRSQSIQERQPLRPSTSDGASRFGQRRHKPQPLVDLASRLPEAPTWRHNQGQGVKAPAGVPLIDLASGPQQPRFVEIPRRELVRRDTSKGSAPQVKGPLPQALKARSRSRSTAGLAAAGHRTPPEEYPPVPPLLMRDANRQKDGDKHGEREPQRGRDTHPREPLSRERSDTLGY
jgi:hypothetical protein